MATTNKRATKRARPAGGQGTKKSTTRKGQNVRARRPASKTSRSSS